MRIQTYWKPIMNKNKYFYLFLMLMLKKPCFLKHVSTIFHYFWKNNVLLVYLNKIQNTVKRNLTYSCFIFPLFHKHLFSPELPHTTRLLKTSYFEKIILCVIEIMLVTLPLVQRNKAQREVNQQIKHRSRQNRDSF